MISSRCPARLWADPVRLAVSATAWAAALQDLDASERATLANDFARVPELFRGRPAVLAHGDFSPVNVLSDGRSLTGLVDFESVRRADPLFDVAWWEWSVSFSSPAVRDAAWPQFLDGAAVDANEPGLFSGESGAELEAGTLGASGSATIASRACYANALR